MNKIEIRGLIKEYDNFRLDNISFDIPEGYVTGFIGRNGSGKTTTIKSILSLIHHGGDVLVDGRKNDDYSYLQKTGVVMDEPLYGKDWTLNHVDRIMKVGYRDWNSNLYREYLKRFGLKESMKVKELSRGMKIKLMLSAALSHNADLLVLDEPTSGLDPEMRDEFTDLIKDFVTEENRTVIFSTHITEDLEKIADYIVFINEGKLVDSLPLDEFMEKYSVIKVSTEGRSRIDPELILGEKGSAFGSELLIRKEDISKVSGDYAEDTIDLDRILILYGRKEEQSDGSHR